MDRSAGRTATLWGLLLWTTAASAAPAPAEVPIPRIHPGATMAAYEGLQYDPDVATSIHGRHPDGRVFSRPISGRAWTMWVRTDQPNDANRAAFLAHLKELGGRPEFEGSPYQVFSAPGTEPGRHWWAVARFLDTRYELRVYEHRTVEVGESVVETLGPTGRRTVSFELNHPGGRFLAAELDAPGGPLTLTLEQVATFGAYRRKVRYRRNFEPQEAVSYHLDDLPQDPGTYQVSLSAVRNHREGAPRLRFVHEHPIEPVEYGEALGGLRVEHAAYGRVTVEPEGDVEIDHPEHRPQSLRADVTPAGAAALLLPAGYWKLRVAPDGYPGMEGLETRMVPVHSGRLTTVTWPRGLESVFGGDGQDGVRVTRIDPDADAATVQVAFQLQGARLDGVEPSRETMSVLDGGGRGTVTRVESEPTPPDVVLLLDSSGSMAGQMAPALAAARAFLKGLPAETRVRVVDFDTEVKTLAGETPAAVLLALDAVKARGATALHDAVLKGLELLAGRRRPTLVLFTDGVDANWNDTGPGSKATKAQVLSAVRKADVPVFTIGFGAGHDADTLERIASLSRGRYFSAADESALDAIFQRVRADLVRAYRLTYARPLKAAPSDDPVVHVVIDTSGSMGSAVPANHNLSRLESVVEILRGFSDGLPDGTMVALQTYNASSGMAQVLTHRRHELHRTLGVLRAGSDTELVAATKAAVAALESVPSTRRTLVFLTDAAIQLPTGHQKTFETMLGRVKDAGIRSLWVGIGIDTSKDRAKAERPFREAAEKAGGQFVVSEDPAAVWRAFQDLGRSIAVEAPATAPPVSVRLTLNHRHESGRVLAFTGSRLATLPPLATGDAVLAPEAVHLGFGPLPPRYTDQVARQIGGSDRPGRDLVVARRLELGLRATGPTLELAASEALVLARLRGLEPPEGSRFLALPLTLSNPGSAPVLVDLPRRLFLRQNFLSELLPISPVTWLTEQPLVTAEDAAFEVPPGQSVSGTVVFRIRDEALRQLSLHLVEVGRPGIDLALLGEGAPVAGPPEAPPAQRRVTLSDRLALELLAVSDHEDFEAIPAPPGTRFRVVDLALVSDRPALLEARAATTWGLALPTPEGELVLAPHDLTGRIPFGLGPRTRLAAGAPTRGRLVFAVPTDLPGPKVPGTLLAALGASRGVLPLAVDAPPAVTGQGPGLRVLGAAGVSRFQDQRGPWLLVDAAVRDTPDAGATRLAGGWLLTKEGQESHALAKDLPAVPRFAWSEPALVHEGRTRRGLLVFRLSAAASQGDRFRLTPPPAWPGTVELTVGADLPDWLTAAGSVQDPGLRPNERGAFRRALAQAVTERHRRGRAKPGAATPIVAEARLREDRPTVPVPSATKAGEATWSSWSEAPWDLAAHRARVEALGYRPSTRGPWRTLQEPGAMLTQGWGTEADFARLGEALLARAARTPRRTTVTVTDAGRAALASRAGVPAVTTRQLPALGFIDDAGASHLLVSPFFRLAADLGGLVGDEAAVPELDGPEAARLRLTVLARPAAEARAGMLGGVTSALKGKASSDRPRSFVLMDHSLELPALGGGAVDVGYAIGDREGPAMVAVLDGPAGRVEGENGLPREGYEAIEELLEIRVHGEWHVHRRVLRDGDDLPGTFRTLGINLPDLPGEALSALDQAWVQARAGQAEADDLSALGWLTRGVLARFVGEQTRSEREAGARLGLVLGRVQSPRVLVVRVATRSGAAAEVSLDLMQAAPDILAGTPEASQSFRVITGLRDAALEGAAVPGGGGVLEAWKQLPSDARLHWVTPKSRAEAAKAMEGAGLPASLVERLRAATHTAFLVPSHAVTHAGSPRWAWLEVDTKSYATVARFDSGERGSMIEFSIGNWAAEAQAYLAGALVGISASIWSVSSFSLALSDRAEILAQAEAFAKSVSSHFSVGASVSGGGAKAGAGMPVGGTPSASTSDGVLKASWSGGKITVGQDMLGFGNGYQAGVEYYFSQKR